MITLAILIETGETHGVLMRTMNAKDAKTNFGQLLDTAIREPVSITRNGRQVAVVLSVQDFERLAALEDASWVRRAERNEAEGFVSREDSEALLRDLLDARD
jgi:prevent-host-death family protein